MRQITIVVCFLLSLYEAHGCNQYMPELDDFVRTRLDEYRKLYNPASVPLDKDITHTLQDAAFAKANKIPQDKDVDPKCPYDKNYQFYLRDKSTCCGGDCVVYFHYPGVLFPTDLVNFQFVVHERECTDPLNTLEKDVDNMIDSPEAYKVILGRPTSSKWAVYSSHINSCYFVFATADESGNNFVTSDICNYENSNFTPIPSKSPIPSIDKSKFDDFLIILSKRDQIFKQLYGIKALRYSLRALRDRRFLAGNLTSSQTITNP